ncbi:MAG: hypothetical protein ACKVU4_05935 [Phycisphaerales bacterium]
MDSHTGSHGAPSAPVGAAGSAEQGRPPSLQPEYYTPEAPPAGPSKALLCIAGAGVAIMALGLAWNIFGPAKAPAQPAPRAPSHVSEQTQMMREAMQMAREAREMQREHMDNMRRMMEEGMEGMEGPPPTEDDGGL